MGSWTMGAKLAAAGTALLALGVGVALFAPLGSSTTSADAAGVTTEVVERTSLWASQHEAAQGVLVAAIGLALVVNLLIRFGGWPGRAVVVAVGFVGLLASMLSIGIFLAPAVACFVGAAIARDADRIERRRARSWAGLADLPPPPAATLR